MKIVVLNNRNKAMTGGQKYNEMLIEYLRQHYMADIVSMPYCVNAYPGWKKIYAPFYELKCVKLIDKNSIVIFADTCYMYHLLLLIVVRFFLKSCPVVIIHHFPYLNDNGVKRVINFIWQIIYYSLCKYIIVPSPYTLSIAKTYFRLNKIIYIPIPFQKRFECSDDFDKGCLLFVGSVIKRKGLLYLLKSLVDVKNEIPYFHLNIVGEIKDKNYNKSLTKYINDHHLQNHISFMGRVSDDKLNDLYKRSEIFVFPSLLEGYGIVLIEAMNHGLPIVAFNNSAIPFTIKDGYNGLLAENKSSVSLAGKIKELVGNCDLRRLLMKGMKDTISQITTKEDFERNIQQGMRRILRSLNS